MVHSTSGAESIAELNFLERTADRVPVIEHRGAFIEKQLKTWTLQMHRFWLTRIACPRSPLPARRSKRTGHRKDEPVTLDLSLAGFELYRPLLSSRATQKRKQAPSAEIASNHQPHVIVMAVTIEIGHHMERDRDAGPRFLPH